MKRFFLLSSLFAFTSGFATIIDRLEKIEREIDQYREAKALEALERAATPFSEHDKWVHFEVHPEFMLMQVKKGGKEHGLVYIGSFFGKDWSEDLEGAKQVLPWSWGYKVGGSIAFPSYDIASSYLHYENGSGNVEEQGDVSLSRLKIRAVDLSLGYKKSAFGVLEFKRSLGAKKTWIDTHQQGLLNHTEGYKGLFDSSFEAVGPLAKLELKLNFFAGMHLQGSIGGSVLYGKELATRSVVPVEGGQSTLISELVEPIQNRFSTLIPTFDFKIGGGWDLVDEKNILVALSVGYEAQYFYLNHPMNHLGESLSSLISMNFDKQLSLLNDLTLYGSVVRLETKF